MGRGAREGHPYNPNMQAIFEEIYSIINQFVKIKNIFLKITFKHATHNPHRQEN